MKTISSVLMVLISSVYAHGNSDFKSKCEAKFTGSISPHLQLVSETAPYKLEIGESNEAKIDFDKYTLVLFFSWTSQPNNKYTPMLELHLFKGNSLEGSLNQVSLSGLELDTRPLNSPMTLSGMKFLNMKINGKQYTRVDYQCSVTKLN